MRNERDHPCYGCKHFYGYEDVETMDTPDRGYVLHVGIPICSRITYEFAMGRCDEFISKTKPKDLSISKSIDNYDRNSNR